MKRASLVLLMMGAGAAQAGGYLEDRFKGPQFEYDFDANQKPWQEIQTQLPAMPKPDGLYEVEVGGGRGHHYYVDPATISASNDGVVRYTLVIRTAGGAENVKFEGMRCEDGEIKLYAFGHRDGSWSRNKYADWAPIDARSDDSYQKELFFHYFCTVDGPADMKTIRRALDRGGIRRGGD